MFYVLQNESTAALRRVPILLTDAATGTTAQTGVGLTTIYPYVNINGGAFAGGAGTVAEAGYGQYYYEFDASEVATLGLAGIHITAAGCRNYDAIAQVAAFNMYSGGGVGISAYDVWALDISGITTAGTAGSQLNTSATGGAGITAGDVWTYDIGGDLAETKLSNAAFYAQEATNQTGSSAIRDAVWDTDVSYLYPSVQAGGALYAAAFGATDAGNQVWNYDISAITTAGTAGSQLNVAASGGAGLTSGDVWSYADRTITGGIADTVTLVSTPVEVSYAAMAGIANTIWSTNISGYTSPSAGFDLTQAASGSGLTAGAVSAAVWNSPVASYSTNGTFGKNILRADAANKVGNVTLYSTGASNGVDADMHRISNDAAAATVLKEVLTGIGGSITANITGNLSGSVGSVTADVNVSTASMTGIAGTVWSTDISGYTSPSAGYDLSNASSGSGISAFDVWDFNITGFGGTNSAAVYVTDTNFIVGNIETYVSTQTPQDIWTYAGIEGRTITGGSVTSVVDGVTVTTNNDKTGYELSGTQSFNLTGNITGDLSGSVGSVTADVNVSTASMSGIAGTVWNTDVSSFTSPSAGYDVHNGAGTAISAFDVWNYTLLSSGVSADSTLGNADDQATGANTNTNSPTLEANIWSYATRTITGGSVTSVVNGVTVSTNNDKTGYSLSGTQSFNLTGNITGSVSGSVGSVIGSVGSVVNPVGVSTTSMTGIAGTVWTYGSRTLTSAATGITAGDVWTYNISGITASGTAGATLNDASVSGSVVTIVNGPYRLTSIAEGTDGRIDILADSVQTIQLNCLDGFGQPFNVTGYAVVVNVYDVSGALTVTYTPTVDFASSGIVSFDIDTDVTGTTGRYTLIVELTAGAEVVQLGPLEILVRPL
jgi:hypothetical protein